VYAHEWNYREAQRSQVGARLARLFADDAATPALPQQRPPLALPVCSNNLHLPPKIASLSRFVRNPLFRPEEVTCSAGVIRGGR